MTIRFLTWPALIGICGILLACAGSASSGPTATIASSPTAEAESTRTATPTTADTTATTTIAAPATNPVAQPTSTPVVEAGATSTQPPGGSARHTIDVLGFAVTLPVGLTMQVYAEGLGSPRFMAFDASGLLYVTDADGRVLALPDENGDGLADEVVVVVDGLDTPHGIAVHDGTLYVAETTRVSRVLDQNGDGRPETLDPIIEGLPDGGHVTRTIAFGPDGLLYVSVGSSCNVCNENDERRAAIVRYQSDGTGEELFAVGLRNAVGLDFNPETGELWVTNNGRDGLGDDIPPETINIVTAGSDFGWPRCHAGTIIDPDYGEVGSCNGVASPAATMQAHSAPLGLEFVQNTALESPWNGSLFVAFHGSWDRTTPTGYKIVALPLANGVPTGAVLDFASGWLLPDGRRWGRPVDVIVAPDGSLLISDDWGGRIFRVFPED